MASEVISETARRVFGHKRLWPGQYEAVRALLDGHDVLLRHPSFGTGVVMGVVGDELTVLFADVGYKTLSLPTVVKQKLLQPA